MLLHQARYDGQYQYNSFACAARNLLLKDQKETKHSIHWWGLQYVKGYTMDDTDCITNACMHIIMLAGSLGAGCSNFVCQLLIQDQGNFYSTFVLDVMCISSSKLCCGRKFSNGFLSKSSSWLTTIVHIAGKKNDTADALSRLPMLDSNTDTMDWVPKPKPLQYSNSIPQEINQLLDNEVLLLLASDERLKNKKFPLAPDMIQWYKKKGWWAAGEVTEYQQGVLYIKRGWGIWTCTLS